MGVGHIEPGERQRARDFDIAGKAHQREFAIVALGEVAADFLDGFFDDVVVVEQPFGGRRDGRAVFDVAGGGAIDAQDFAFVFLVARKEVEGLEDGKRVDLAGRKPLANLGKTVNRQIVCTNGVVVLDPPGLGFRFDPARRVLKSCRVQDSFRHCAALPLICPQALTVCSRRK